MWVKQKQYGCVTQAEGLGKGQTEQLLWVGPGKNPEWMYRALEIKRCYSIMSSI